MAVAESNTVVRVPHPSDAAIGSQVRDWESEMYNLRAMCGIATNLVEDLFNRRRLQGIPDTYYIDEAAVEQTLFAIYETNYKTRDLVGKYVRALEA